MEMQPKGRKPLQPSGRFFKNTPPLASELDFKPICNLNFSSTYSKLKKGFR